MNPPSALHSAMSRDRKPFTYTPGGINLSEIKSQRMAQRLMRNAMNPGVPEIPVHPVLPSATPGVPIALPNYNCLPVQVFPAMPANPKTLLRSRSHPDQRDTSIYKPITPSSINNVRFDDNDSMNNKNRLTNSLPTNNDRRVSLNEYNTASKDYNATNLNYANDRFTVASNTNLLYTSPHKAAFAYAPEVVPISSLDLAPLTTQAVPPAIKFEYDATPVFLNSSTDPEFFRIPKLGSTPTTEQFCDMQIFDEKDTIIEKKDVETCINKTADPLEDVNSINEEVPATSVITKIAEENEDIDNDQREVKVVKKQVTKENKVQEQNGNENKDTNDEAELSVKIPTKKSGARTETKVEVEKRTLPDGSIEEVKTTTTKTTIDGRTEIKTRTETTIIPKDEESEEEIVEEEEEEAQEVNNEDDTGETEITRVTEKISAPKENGNVSKTEERSETTIVKKVAVVQESPKPEQSEIVEQEDEEVEEEEDVVEAEPVTIVLKKQATPEPKIKSKPVEEEEEEEDEEEEIVEESEDAEQEIVQEEVKTDIKEEELVEKEESEPEEEVEKVKETVNKNDEEESEEEYEEVEEEKQETQVEQKTEVKENIEKEEEDSIKESTKEVKEEETISGEVTSETKEAIKEKERVITVQVQESEQPKLTTKEDKPEEKPTEFTIPIREPSIPLDKVEDIEIKPIGITPIITKTHTENTEITRSTVDPSGGLSRQTEYNKIENIVTVNRTTKILDQNYENLTQQGIPTVKTYFPPPSTERFSGSTMPSRPYQPVYPPESVPERRHSLLLERLSMERQMPSDVYQFSNQSYEQTQYQSEPQSEVLAVSNVKPSTITNQQWYQQTKENQNVLYNNVTSTPNNTGAPFALPKSPQPQQQYQSQQQYHSQQQYQSQPQYQPPPPSQFQRGTTPQPQFQRGATPQSQYQKVATPQPQYQPSYSEPQSDKAPVNNYSSYTPNSTWISNTVEAPPPPYSYLNKDTTQSYQKSTLNSTTQYSTGYVPPPWEQDSSYTSVNNTSEKYYQEVPQSTAFSPAPSQGWKPTPAPAKFTKPAPIAYAPPAPNQSFVKPAAELPRHPGRKTYYSEYERRYITVPESTYIPTETKFQPQPDSSPQYYYDNTEPSEPVEPQWRKELREFTEKTSQTQTVEQTNIKPPWESDPKYAKTLSSTYTPTPTWSQTLRPQSNRERSFESEYVSQEWPKTNTLGRRRPLSTVGVSMEGKVDDRVRGVSVDRYNPNNYQPPAEHPPVQTHTLTTPVHTGYHNPNVPAYHTRASAEPREQPIPYQQRVYRESRASPLQSRSFKYLQWITGTEN